MENGEQIEQFKNDGYIDLEWGKNRFYIEADKDGNFIYGEVSSMFDNEDGDSSRSSYCFDTQDLQKMRPRRPYDPSYYHDYPLCPSCSTYMIYKFECCPKCGQALDWRGRD